MEKLSFPRQEKLMMVPLEASVKVQSDKTIENSIKIYIFCARSWGVGARKALHGNMTHSEEK